MVEELITLYDPELAVHRACEGGDDEFDQLCVKLHVPRLVMPSTARTRIPNSVIRARGGQVSFNEPLPPLVRDKLIVKKGSALIACPWLNYEVLRSGTWSTVRYARKIRGMQISLLFAEVRP